MEEPKTETVKKSLAAEYPEFVGRSKKTKEKYFDMAGLMRKKGHIE